MRRNGLIITALLLAAPAHAEPDPGPIAIYGNRQTIELAPVLLAAQDFYPGEASVRMGGVPNLVGEAGKTAPVSVVDPILLPLYSVNSYGKR